MRFLKLFIALSFCLGTHAVAQSEVARPGANPNLTRGVGEDRITQIPSQGQCFPQIQDWLDHDENDNELGQIGMDIWRAIKETSRTITFRGPSGEDYNVSANECYSQHPRSPTDLRSSPSNYRERFARRTERALWSSHHLTVRSCTPQKQNFSEQQKRESDLNMVDRYYYGLGTLEQYSSILLDQIAAIDAGLSSAGQPVLEGFDCRRLQDHPELSEKCQHYQGRCERISPQSFDQLAVDVEEKYLSLKKIEAELSELKNNRTVVGFGTGGPENRGYNPSATMAREVSQDLTQKINLLETLKAEILRQYPFISGEKFKEELKRAYRTDLNEQTRTNIVRASIRAQQTENRRLLLAELDTYQALKRCFGNTSSTPEICQDHEDLNEQILKAARRTGDSLISTSQINQFRTQTSRLDRSLDQSFKRQACLIRNSVERAEAADVTASVAIDLALFATPIGLSRLAVKTAATTAIRLGQVSAAVEVAGAAGYTAQALNAVRTSCGEQQRTLSEVQRRPASGTELCPSYDNQISQSVRAVDSCVFDSLVASAEALGFGVAVKVARNLRRGVSVATPSSSAVSARPTLPPLKEIQRNARYSPAQKAEQLEVVLGRPTGSLKDNPTFVRELQRIEAQFPTPVSQLPAARRPRSEKQNLVKKREELLKLKDAQGRPLFTTGEIQRGMDHGLLGTPDSIPDELGSVSLNILGHRRILDGVAAPPKLRPSEDVIKETLTRARAEREKFDYRRLLEPQLGEVGPAFSGKKGSPETLRNGFGGARNAGVEIVEGPERPLFVKISTVKSEGASLRSFNNEVFFTKLLSDLGKGPEFHGVFSRKIRPGGAQYVEPDNLRIMTDAVPGENFQLSATTAETVRNFSLQDIEAIEREAISLVEDLKILPGDFQVRVARSPDGAPQIYVVDPAQYSFINGDTARARENLAKGFQEMRAKKIVTMIADQVGTATTPELVTRARLKLEKMDRAQFESTLRRFESLPSSEWASFIRGLKAP